MFWHGPGNQNNQNLWLFPAAMIISFTIWEHHRFRVVVSGTRLIGTDCLHPPPVNSWGMYGMLCGAQRGPTLIVAAAGQDDNIGRPTFWRGRSELLCEEILSWQVWYAWQMSHVWAGCLSNSSCMYLLDDEYPTILKNGIMSYMIVYLPFWGLFNGAPAF